MALIFLKLLGTRPFYQLTLLSRLNRKKQKLERKEKSRLLNKVGTKTRLNKITTTANFEKHVHVAIDCKYDRLMADQDMAKLGKQIAWCYKVNRRSQHPVQVSALNIFLVQ